MTLAGEMGTQEHGCKGERHTVLLAQHSAGAHGNRVAEGREPVLCSNVGVSPTHQLQDCGKHLTSLHGICSSVQWSDQGASIAVF